MVRTPPSPAPPRNCDSKPQTTTQDPHARTIAVLLAWLIGLLALVLLLSKLLTAFA